MQLSAHHHISQQHENGSRQNDTNVDSEFIAHAAPLRARSHNSSVGYEAEVVAEECTTHNNAHEEGHAGIGGLGYTGCYWHQGDYRSNARTDAHGYKT